MVPESLLRLLFGEHPPAWIWAIFAGLGFGVLVYFTVTGSYVLAAISLAYTAACGWQAVPGRPERLSRSRDRDRRERRQRRAARQRRTG